MAEKDLAAIFISARGDIVENLSLLQKSIKDCEDADMPIPDENLYEQLEALMDEADDAQTFAQLAEVIVHAKAYEAIIDSWVTRKGMTSHSLIWPKTSY